MEKKQSGELISDEYIADHVGAILNNYRLKGCLTNQFYIIQTENLVSILLNLLVEFYCYKDEPLRVV